MESKVFRMNIYRMFAMLVVGLAFGCSAQAQELSEKALNKHLKKVEKSRLKGSVVLSLDTIFNSGVPYAILKKRKGLFTRNYGVYSLTGEELIDIKHDCDDVPDSKYAAKSCYRTYLFLETGAVAEVPEEFMKDVEDVLVENALMVEGKVDPKSEKRFVMKYSPKHSAISSLTFDLPIGSPTSTNVEPRSRDNAYVLVKRNKSSIVFINREEIEQDFKVIGHFEKRSELGNEVKEVYSIYLNNGTLAAEARQVEMNSSTYSILTFKDNRTHRLTVEMIGTTVKNIAEFLIERGYL